MARPHQNRHVRPVVGVLVLIILAAVVPAHGTHVLAQYAGSAHRPRTKIARTHGVPSATVTAKRRCVASHHGVNKAVVCVRARTRVRVEGLPAHPVGPLFGVGSFVTQRSSSVAALLIRRSRLLGAGWVREELTATRLHDSAYGAYHWASFDRVIRAERRAGFQVLGLLDYSNTWRLGDHGAMPHAAIGRISTEFAAYVTAVVRHYRRQVRYWQIWNEPDLATHWEPGPSARDYATLLRTAYTAAKRANPRAQVVVGGTSGVNVPFLRAVRAAGGAFDVVAVQPYRTAPETKLFDQVRALKAFHRPIWFSEIGWPAGDGCWSLCTDEAAQSAYLVRFYTLAAATGVGRVFWYDLRDDAHLAQSAEAHFGLLRRDLSAKPAFSAYARLSRLLRGSWFVRADVTGQAGIYAVRFAGPNGVVVVTWNRSSAAVTVHLPWRVGLAQVTDLWGVPLGTLYPRRSRLAVMVPPGGMPLYIMARALHFHLPPLGPLLHFAPTPTPVPPSAPPPPRPRATPTPGGAWKLPTLTTGSPSPTATPPAEHHLPGTRTATATPVALPAGTPPA